MEITNPVGRRPVFCLIRHKITIYDLLSVCKTIILYKRIFTDCYPVFLNLHRYGYVSIKFRISTINYIMMKNIIQYKNNKNTGIYKTKPKGYISIKDVIILNKAKG